MAVFGTLRIRLVVSLFFVVVLSAFLSILIFDLWQFVSMEVLVAFILLTAFLVSLASYFFLKILAKKSKSLRNFETSSAHHVVTRDREDEQNYRKEFVGNVAHELKTPVFNAQGYIETLIEGGWEDADINMDYLHNAAKNIDRLNDIVSNLMKLSDINSGELILEKSRFDVVALVKKIFVRQELLAKQRNVKLFVRQNISSKWAFADEKAIETVLENLIINAIRYGNVDSSVRVSCSDAGDKLRIEVSDFGKGISAEHIPHLFKRFYRVDTARSREFGGTGLGLSIVKNIITAHGEEVWVKSVIDIGSTFGFYLPKA